MSTDNMERGWEGNTVVETGRKPSWAGVYAPFKPFACSGLWAEPDGARMIGTNPTESGARKTWNGALEWGEVVGETGLEPVTSCV